MIDILRLQPLSLEAHLTLLDYDSIGMCIVDKPLVFDGRLRETSNAKQVAAGSAFKALNTVNSCRLHQYFQISMNESCLY